MEIFVFIIVCIILLMGVTIFMPKDKSNKKEGVSAKTDLVEDSVENQKIRISKNMSAVVVVLACGVGLFMLMSYLLSPRISVNESPNELGSNTENSHSSREGLLRERLQYLSEIEEVSWWIVDDNSVYIGFNTICSDLKQICNAAAFHGNKTIDFGCHVYALDAKDYPYATNSNFRHVYSATYRHGKMQ